MNTQHNYLYLIFLLLVSLQANATSSFPGSSRLYIGAINTENNSGYFIGSDLLIGSNSGGIGLTLEAQDIDQYEIVNLYITAAFPFEIVNSLITFRAGSGNEGVSLQANYEYLIKIDKKLSYSIFIGYQDFEIENTDQSGTRLGINYYW